MRRRLQGSREDSRVKPAHPCQERTAAWDSASTSASSRPSIAVPTASRSSARRCACADADAQLCRRSAVARSAAARSARRAREQGRGLLHARVCLIRTLQNGGCHGKEIPVGKAGK